MTIIIDCVSVYGLMTRVFLRMVVEVYALAFVASSSTPLYGYVKWHINE